MEGVGEHHLCIGAAQLLGANALTVAAVHRHETWGLHHAMGNVEAPRAGLGMGAAMRSSSGTEQQCSTPTAAQCSPYGEAQDGGSTQRYAQVVARSGGSWIFTQLRSGLG